MSNELPQQLQIALTETTYTFRLWERFLTVIWPATSVQQHRDYNSLPQKSHAPLKLWDECRSDLRSLGVVTPLTVRGTPFFAWQLQPPEEYWYQYL